MSQSSDAGVEPPKTKAPRGENPQGALRARLLAAVFSAKGEGGPGLARARRLALVAVFALQFTVLDVALRGPRAALLRWTSLPTALASALVWGTLALSVRSRSARFAVGGAAAAFAVVQGFVFRFYGVFVDGQVLASARHAWSDVAPVVMKAALPATALWVVVAAAELAWLSAARPALRAPSATRRLRRQLRLPVAASLGAAWLVALACAPLGRGTPDAELTRAASILLRPAEARSVAVTPVPPVTGERATPPAVLLVVTESVRASDYGPSSGTHPAIDAALPSRVDLGGLRAVASYTAVSVSALFTGRAQLGPRQTLLEAPSLFHLARAVVEPTRLRTAYYSAHLRAVLEGRDVRSALDAFVTLETLLGHELDDEGPEFGKGYDRMLVDRFALDAAAHAGPGLTVLHFAGTHVPYFVDEAHAPFKPWTQTVSWRELEGLHHAYENAIFAQDLEVARAVRTFVDAQRGGPWVVVFTSDHGESFGEAGAIHHGQNLLEEQAHVPGWIAWGGGALDDTEAEHARAYAGRVTTHLDVAPTVLDALGVLEGLPPSLRRELVGRSWLRAPEALAPVPITNCTALFPCPLDTWGVLLEGVQLSAQPWDTSWRCFSLRDLTAMPMPNEDPSCGAAMRASRAWFPTRPGGAPND